MIKTWGNIESDGGLSMTLQKKKISLKEKIRWYIPAILKYILLKEINFFLIFNL